MTRVAERSEPSRELIIEALGVRCGSIKLGTMNRKLKPVSPGEMLAEEFLKPQYE